MLLITGNARVDQTCSRRSILKAGTAGLIGFGLVDVLRAEQAAGIHGSRKALINVHLDGGAPHMDLTDLKPEAPSEIRGEFLPIATRLPGFEICELMPKLASIADRFAFIRSLVGSVGAHDAFQTQSGYASKDLQSLGGRPALGSTISKLQSSPSDGAPAFVDLMQGRGLVRNSARPGFLGPAYQPFRPDISHLFQRELEAGMKGELARLGQDHQVRLELNGSLSIDRLQSRTDLLSGLDRLKRNIDGSGMMSAMDQFHQQAVSILTSGSFADALDFNREPAASLARYTLPSQSSSLEQYTSEGPESVRKFLLARRLIEAGVRCVSISLSDFDTHSNNFGRMKQLLPILDHGLHALVTDLGERGLTDDVTIVVWGEFGRTPRIDPKTAGRHHWPQVGPCLLAGGGMKMGQVIGATDRTASVAVSRPVTYKDIFAQLYANLGIDARRTTLTDPQGRPQHLLDEGEPLSELRG